MSRTVEIVQEDGTVAEVSLQSKRFNVVLDGERLEPAVCQEIEVESNGNVDTTGTQCGDIRQRNTGNDPFAVTIQGIVTSGDSEGMLNVRNLLYDIQEGSELRFISDFPIDEPMEVSNVIVTQSTDLVTVDIPRLTDGKEPAFDFQLQLGAQENQQ